MLRLFTLVLTNLLAFSSVAQTIELRQTKNANDFKVKNGDYIIYFKKSDIISAISEIDKTINTNSSTLAALIKDNKLTSLDFSSISQTDKPFADLIKSNLGSLLLLKGKAAVFLGADPISKIVAEESPEMVDLNGNSKTSIFFSEEGVDTPIFLGDLNTKLKQR